MRLVAGRIEKQDASGAGGRRRGVGAGKADLGLREGDVSAAGCESVRPRKPGRRPLRCAETGLGSAEMQQAGGQIGLEQQGALGGAPGAGSVTAFHEQATNIRDRGRRGRRERCGAPEGAQGVSHLLRPVSVETESEPRRRVGGLADKGLAQGSRGRPSLCREVSGEGPGKPAIAGPQGHSRPQECLSPGRLASTEPEIRQFLDAGARAHRRVEHLDQEGGGRPGGRERSPAFAPPVATVREKTPLDQQADRLEACVRLRAHAGRTPACHVRPLPVEGVAGLQRVADRAERHMHTREQGVQDAAVGDVIRDSRPEGRLVGKAAGREMAGPADGNVAGIRPLRGLAPDWRDFGVDAVEDDAGADEAHIRPVVQDCQGHEEMVGEERVVSVEEPEDVPLRPGGGEVARRAGAPVPAQHGQGQALVRVGAGPAEHRPGGAVGRGVVHDTDMDFRLRPAGGSAQPHDGARDTVEGASDRVLGPEGWDDHSAQIGLLTGPRGEPIDGDAEAARLRRQQRP